MKGDPADSLPLEISGNLDRAIEKSLPSLAALLLDLARTQDKARLTEPSGRSGAGVRQRAPRERAAQGSNGIRAR
jgi:hypothetical protein